jgi:hypothetical protein
MQTLSAQASLLQQSRMKPLEVVFWLLAFAAPVLTPSHALIINEIAIVALFAVSLDIILGYTGMSLWATRPSSAWAAMQRRCLPNTSCPTRWSAWLSALPRPRCWV